LVGCALIFENNIHISVLRNQSTEYKTIMLNVRSPNVEDKYLLQPDGSALTLEFFMCPIFSKSCEPHQKLFSDGTKTYHDIADKFFC